MIALDTNVLLRYVLQDDVRQSALAARLVENDLAPSAPGFVSLVVVCELVWALSQTYAISRDKIVAFLALLVESAQILVEDGNAVVAAAISGGDIADSIIHHIGQRHGCSHSVTFDRKFARLEGVELLK